MGSVSSWPLAEAAHARLVRQQWQPNTLLPRANTPSVHTGVCTGLAVVLHRPRTHRTGGALLRGECARTIALLTPLQALCLPACT